MMTWAAETPSPSWMSGRDAAPVVGDRGRAVGVEGHHHAGPAAEGLVDGVVQHLVDHVVQARAVIGVADVHAWALAHRVEALQDLDGIRAVIGSPIVFSGVVSLVGHLRVQWGETGGFHAHAQRLTLERIEQRFVRAREEGLQAERADFLGQSGAPEGVQMRRNFVQ